MIVMGIDPGKDGAVVMLNDPPLVWLAANDYTVRVSKSKRAYVEGQMATIVTVLRPDLVILERQRAMPKQGSTSAYTTGLGEGIWRGILAASGVPWRLVAPQEWTKVMFKGMPGDGKGRAVLVCQRELPQLDLTPGKRRKPHDGIADAACMALYGQRQGGQDG